MRGPRESMGRAGGGWAGPRPARPDVAAGPVRPVAPAWREVTSPRTLPLGGPAFGPGCRVRPGLGVLRAWPHLSGPGSRPSREGGVGRARTNCLGTIRAALRHGLVCPTPSASPSNNGFRPVRRPQGTAWVSVVAVIPRSTSPVSWRLPPRGAPLLRCWRQTDRQTDLLAGDSCT